MVVRQRTAQGSDGTVVRRENVGVAAWVDMTDGYSDRVDMAALADVTGCSAGHILPGVVELLACEWLGVDAS